MAIPRSALAVVAHPDDESFGLGAVLTTFVKSGTDISVICFTQGEASTLNGVSHPASSLHEVRADELAAAADVLGVCEVSLLHYPDGRLHETSPRELAEPIVAAARRRGHDLLLVFDENGVTGHSDHRRATEAALWAADRLGLPVTAWTVTDRVATRLNEELGTTFMGRPPEQIDVHLVVDRRAQLEAIACHRSQATDNPVLWRRLELSGSHEPLRMLRAAPPTAAPVS
jgi:N-acetylglucosamine malate deacetylase 2